MHEISWKMRCWKLKWSSKPGVNVSWENENTGSDWGNDYSWQNLCQNQSLSVTTSSLTVLYGGLNNGVQIKFIGWFVAEHCSSTLGPLSHPKIGSWLTSELNLINPREIKNFSLPLHPLVSVWGSIRDRVTDSMQWGAVVHHDTSLSAWDATCSESHKPYIMCVEPQDKPFKLTRYVTDKVLIHTYAD